MAFTNSKLVNYTRISPNRTKNRNHAIDTITIHCVCGQCSVKTLGSIFADPNKQASSNYGIGPDGKIGMYVEEKDRSWCTSSAANDHRAITIEVASDTKHPYAVNDAAYKALIDLLVDICQRNDIKELKWEGDKSLIGQIDKQNMTVHRWFANKSCPGEYLYSRHGKIASEVNARLNKTETPKVETIKTEKPKAVETKPVESVKINKGDVVSIVKNATYYDGKSIPPWVLDKQWVVKSVSGNRIVIDKSSDGKDSIESPVHAKYLKVVTAKPVVTKEEPFMVNVDSPYLNIRTGPGTNYAKTGMYTGKGIFTIVETKKGEGSKNGWGLLKSGSDNRDRWIALDFAKRI